MLLHYPGLYISNDLLLFEALGQHKCSKQMLSRELTKIWGTTGLRTQRLHSLLESFPSSEPLTCERNLELLYLLVRERESPCACHCHIVNFAKAIFLICFGNMETP